MGFTTVVLIRNDAFDELEKYPKEFVAGINVAMHNGGTVPVGNHCNPVEVMPTSHADVQRLYFATGNTLLEFDPYRLPTWLHNKEWHLQQLKDAKRILREYEKALKEALKDV